MKYNMGCMYTNQTRMHNMQAWFVLYILMINCTVH